MEGRGWRNSTAKRHNKDGTSGRTERKTLTPRANPSMFIRYFISVPKLPREYADQTNAVAIVRYPCTEGKVVRPGEPIAIVETWWAVLQIEPVKPCRIEKTLYDNPGIRGVEIKEGEPIALAFCDPEDIPEKGDNALFKLLEQKREKPRV
jgi:hypothetical protein